MSTIEEVRTAEKKVQEVLDALKKAGAQDPDRLSADLKNATDDYARAVRELNSHQPTAWNPYGKLWVCQRNEQNPTKHCERPIELKSEPKRGQSKLLRSASPART